MKELVTILNFGQVIAYLIPGFIGVYSLSRFSKFLNTLLISTTENPILQLDNALILILMSVAVGLIISAARMVFLDEFMLKRSGTKYKFNFRNLLNTETRITYDSLVLNSWRFAQFYGNMIISLITLILSNWHFYQTGVLHHRGIWTLILLVTTYILFVAYKIQYRRTHDLANTLIGV